MVFMESMASALVKNTKEELEEAGSTTAENCEEALVTAH